MPVMPVTDDDNADFLSQAQLDQLGTIRVDCFRVVYHGTKLSRTHSRSRVNDRLENSTMAIHERTKKAGSHRVL